MTLSTTTTKWLIGAAATVALIGGASGAAIASTSQTAPTIEDSTNVQDAQLGDPSDAPVIDGPIHEATVDTTP